MLCFFVGNDVTGIPVRGEVMLGRLYYLGAPARWRNFLRRSRVYVLAETVWVKWIKAPLLARMRTHGEAANVAGLAAPGSCRIAAVAETIGGEPVPPLDGRYVDIESRNVPVYQRNPGPQMARLWAEAEAQILAFDAVCRDACLPWVLLLIPEEL